MAVNFISKIRQFFCRHEWRPTKFQALVPVTSYECVKCGKHAYRDWERTATPSARPKDR